MRSRAGQQSVHPCAIENSQQAISSKREKRRANPALSNVSNTGQTPIIAYFFLAAGFSFTT